MEMKESDRGHLALDRSARTVGICRRACGWALALCFLFHGGSTGAEIRHVMQTAREVPVAYEADVVVVGGNSGAVAAASAAAGKGAKVFLAAPMPYLGEDMCATLRLWLEPGEIPDTPLAERLFPQRGRAQARQKAPDSQRGGGAAVPSEWLYTPLSIKAALDNELLSAGVEFLFSCHVTDLLADAQGAPGGIVMANRAGRQAVRARVIIDATERASAARLAGAAFTAYPGGEQTFSRVIIGSGPREIPNGRVRIIPSTFKKTNERGSTEREPVNLIEYTLRLPMRDGGCASWAQAEQLARDMTYAPGQLMASDTLFQVPPDQMKGKTSWTREADPSTVDLDAFRPSGIARMYVLGGCADVPRDEAARLLRPIAYVALGSRMGEAAAAEAKSAGAPASLSVKAQAQPAGSAIRGDVREVLAGVRPVSEGPRVALTEHPIPVLGEYDVVVVGGGTSGAPAAIGAARRGARTLVVEMLHALGGVGTLGMIGSYYGGRPPGFTTQIPTDRGPGNEGRMEWYRTEIRKAGGDIWFGAIGCGAVVDGTRVVGAVLATPWGRGVALADTVVDATGSADIAVAAGAEWVYTGASEIAVQGTGLSVRALGVRSQNSDFTLADETDMKDVWTVFVHQKRGRSGGFDQSQVLLVRERRRIVGDFTPDINDYNLRRTYPDIVGQASGGNYDTHGYTVAPFLFLAQPVKGLAYIPYRCLLPRGLDGIIVAGLGISVDRDVLPVFRMQGTLENIGYVAGVAAAMASKQQGRTRAVAIKDLQAHLAELGAFGAGGQAGIPTADSFPLAEERIRTAVQRAGSQRKSRPDTDLWNMIYDPESISAIVSHWDIACPLVCSAHKETSDQDARLIYAHILGIMGDPAGAETLAAAVDARKDWGPGWNIKGLGQYGWSISRLDSLIVALGRTRDTRALAPLLAKTELLDASIPFSHHRAAALALEALGRAEAAPRLAAVLSKEGMQGYVLPPEMMYSKEGRAKFRDFKENALREIGLARALFRCGDHDGLGGKILEAYVCDHRGHFVRHAKAVLNGQ